MNAELWIRKWKKWYNFTTCKLYYLKDEIAQTRSIFMNVIFHFFKLGYVFTKRMTFLFYNLIEVHRFEYEWLKKLI